MSDTNVNFAKCLKEVSDFGTTHVHNICSGNVTDVTWGSADWVGAVFLVCLGVTMIAMLGGFAVSMIRDI